MFHSPPLSSFVLPLWWSLVTVNLSNLMSKQKVNGQGMPHPPPLSNNFFLPSGHLRQQLISLVS